jgi:hypothetical protein
MMAGRRDERHDRVMVGHNVIFADAQLEIEHVKEFALDPTNVALAEYARAHGPVHVLERRVIQVLARDDEGAKEYSFVGPLFECDVEVGLGPVEIDECGQDDRHFYFGPDEDVVDHGRECRSFVPPRDGTAAAGMRRAIESKVDSLDDRVDEVFCVVQIRQRNEAHWNRLLLTDDGAGELLVDEVEECE